MPRLRKRISPVSILLAIGVFLLAVSILLPSYRRWREVDRPDRCARNLRQLGQSLLLYSMEKGGLYPNRLEEVLTSGAVDVTPEIFVCPESGMGQASGKTLAELRASFSSGNHVSYLFLVPGRKMGDVKDSEIIVYEPVTHHLDGANVLFGDGHVQWLTKEELEGILALQGK